MVQEVKYLVNKAELYISTKANNMTIDYIRNTPGLVQQSLFLVGFIVHATSLRIVVIDVPPHFGIWMKCMSYAPCFLLYGSNGDFLRSTIVEKLRNFKTFTCSSDLSSIMDTLSNRAVFFSKIIGRMTFDIIFFAIELDESKELL